MEPETNNASDFTRYLLGDLTDEQLAKVEASFIDDGAYEQFLLAEQDLIDRYLTGELTLPERELFEDHYLEGSPDRLEKVAKAQAVFAILPNLVPATLPTFDHMEEESWRHVLGGFMKNPVAIFSYVASLLLVSVSIIVYFRHDTSSRLAEQTELTRQQLEQTTRQIKERDAEIGKLKATLDQLQLERDTLAKHEEELRVQLENRNLKQSTIALMLSPFGAKGTDEGKTLKIRSEIKFVKLNLKLRPGLSYEAYRVRLNGKAIGENLHAKQTAGGSEVTLQILSSQLIPGINSIELSGRSDGSDYQKVDGYSVQIDKR